MSAHVLLNLLNKLRKRDKIQGLPSILSLFRNKFNKFNTAGAGMLNDIKTITFFYVKTSIFCHLLCSVNMDVIILLRY